MASGDNQLLFDNLPPRFTGRIRAQAGPTKARAAAGSIVEPPEPSAQALYHAATAAPLAGLFWRGALATPLLQQYLASLRQPGATGQADAPAPPQSW